MVHPHMQLSSVNILIWGLDQDSKFGAELSQVRQEHNIGIGTVEKKSNNKSHEPCIASSSLQAQ